MSPARVDAAAASATHVRLVRQGEVAPPHQDTLYGGAEPDGGGELLSALEAALPEASAR